MNVYDKIKMSVPSLFLKNTLIIGFVLLLFISLLVFLQVSYNSSESEMPVSVSPESANRTVIQQQSNVVPETIQETILEELQSSVLKRGSQGLEVQKLQKFLNNSGFTLAMSGYGSPGRETYYFGPLTESALQNYQATNGLFPSGVLEPETELSINRAFTDNEISKLSTPSVTEIETQVPISETITNLEVEIAQIQAILAIRAELERRKSAETGIQEIADTVTPYPDDRCWSGSSHCGSPYF